MLRETRATRPSTRNRKMLSSRRRAWRRFLSGCKKREFASGSPCTICRSEAASRSRTLHHTRAVRKCPQRPSRRRSSIYWRCRDGSYCAAISTNGAFISIKCCFVRSPSRFGFVVETASETASEMRRFNGLKSASTRFTKISALAIHSCPHLEGHVQSEPWQSTGGAQANGGEGGTDGDVLQAGRDGARADQDGVCHGARRTSVAIRERWR